MNNYISRNDTKLSVETILEAKFPFRIKVKRIQDTDQTYHNIFNKSQSDT